MKAILAIALLTTLSACASGQQIAATHDRECRALGAQPGTPTYVDCRLRKEQMSRAAPSQTTVVVDSPQPLPEFHAPQIYRPW